MCSLITDSNDIKKSSNGYNDSNARYKLEKFDEEEASNGGIFPPKSFSKEIFGYAEHQEYGT